MSYGRGNRLLIAVAGYADDNEEVQAELNELKEKEQRMVRLLAKRRLPQFDRYTDKKKLQNDLQTLVSRLMNSR